MEELVLISHICAGVFCLFAAAVVTSKYEQWKNAQWQKGDEEPHDEE